MTSYNTHTLANGLRIIHCPNDSDVVYCGYAVKAGTRNEHDNEVGLAHFCEHMTFKGTAHLSPMKVINALERVGGELNAYTAKEETVYYAAVLRQHFSKAVDLLTEIVFHSEYPQEEIDKEVEVVCDEIESYRDSPAELIYDDLENELFHDQDLGHSVLGTEESVRAFTTSDCRAFTSRLYTPQRAVFYVVGNINFPALVRRLEKAFDGEHYPIDDRLCTISQQPLPTVDARCKTTKMDTHQAHVMMAVPIRGELDQWRMPLFLTNNLLGGPSMNSRLNISLREKRGLVYTVESMMTTYTDTLLWSAYFGCDHNDVKRCIRLINNELERLRRAPLSSSALHSMKQQIKGQIALASQNKENYGIDMAKQYLHYNKLKDMQRLFDRIDAVKAEDIHRLMNEVITPDNLFTLIYT